MRCDEVENPRDRSAAPAMSTVDPFLPRPGRCTLPRFRFASGQVLPELHIAYTTLGPRDGEPVLVLHGTAGSAASMQVAHFAGALFGPGQALDARRHFIVLPDAIGAGGSSKPSDGLRSDFPAYGLDDLVQAQHRLLTEHLGLGHLRALVGYSMGGMCAWLWATRHPGFVDVLVPLAAPPVALAGRNWMMRRLLIEAIRRDPDWQGGHYTAPPRGLALALLMHAVATNGGDLALHRQAPTRAAADAWIDARLQAGDPPDANDLLYQWSATRDYDPGPALERITARVLAVLSSDDERNPPELGLLEPALARIAHARALCIPGSAETAGHATVMHARHWAAALAELLAQAPRLAAG